MPVANIMNFNGTVSGDMTILEGIEGRSWRTRQLNVQNLDEATTTRITVKTGMETVVGPVLIKPGALLSLELASEEHQDMFIFPNGGDVIINSSEEVELTVFGFVRSA